MARWLWSGNVEMAKARLQDWQRELRGLPQLPALDQAVTYLENQRDWIGSYDQWRKQGYPVGSGIIERAIALVINRRMRETGYELVEKECDRRGCCAGRSAQSGLATLCHLTALSLIKSSSVVFDPAFWVEPVTLCEIPEPLLPESSSILNRIDI